MLINIIKVFFTNAPMKKFMLEVELMLHFSGKNRILRKYFQRRIYYKYNCEISHSSKIDTSVRFIHPIAIVIGSNAIIEKNCMIYQCVTIGSTASDNNKMPYIKEGTIVYAGAKLIGGITIGKNCTVGANAVVTKSVPDNSIVVGVNKIHKKTKENIQNDIF